MPDTTELLGTTENLSQDVVPANPDIYFNNELGDYFFLSNDYPCTIIDDDRGGSWQSATHWYIGSKTVRGSDKENIRQAKSVAEARKLGRKIQVERSWDNAKVRWMVYIIRSKFEQYEDLKQKLIDTYPQMLIYRVPGDKFWGCGDNGNGRNMLGELLMDLRSKFMDNEE